MVVHVWSFRALKMDENRLTLSGISIGKVQLSMAEPCFAHRFGHFMRHGYNIGKRVGEVLRYCVRKISSLSPVHFL